MIEREEINLSLFSDTLTIKKLIKPKRKKEEFSEAKFQK